VQLLNSLSLSRLLHQCQLSYLRDLKPLIMSFTFLLSSFIHPNSSVSFIFSTFLLIGFNKALGFSWYKISTSSFLSSTFKILFILYWCTHKSLLVKCLYANIHYYNIKSRERDCTNTLAEFPNKRLPPFRMVWLLLLVFYI